MSGGVERVIDALRMVGLEGVLCLEEDDPQYHAVRHVATRLGPGPAAVLGALNALVSYRLAMRGEEWWWCWARTVSGSPVASVEDALRVEEQFLKTCRGSIAGRDAKLRRLRRALGARGALERLLGDPASVLGGARWLTRALATALGAKEWSKTIVFAAKIAYYAARTVAGRRPAPWDVDIPVDVRVACFLYSTGAVEAQEYRELVSRPRPAQEAVRTIAEKTGIPPLNLDTIFWRLGWIPRDLPPGEWAHAISRIVGSCFPGETLAPLFVRPCTGRDPRGRVGKLRGDT